MVKWPHVLLFFARGSDFVKSVFLISLIVCMAIVGAASAEAAADNLTENATVNLTANTSANLTETSAEALIGGDMGIYLVKANVDGANVTFDSDYKGVIKEGQLKVEVYTTGTPYKVITVEKSGYEVYKANITSVPAKNETVDISVTLVPLAAANVTADTGNATATAELTTEVAHTLVPVTTDAEPTTTKAGSLPFAVFGAFVVLGILAIRSRR